MDASYLVPVAQLMRDVPSTTQLVFCAPFDADHEFAPRGRAETDVDADAIVDVALTLQSFSGGLRAKGRVSAPWFGVCRRCSVAVLGVSDVAVDERFVDHLDTGDEDAYVIENDFVDLAPMVHDAILLDLPLAPLCREDCAGLCPYCGIDRNEATCDCSAPVDPRWATLDGLRFADGTSAESNEA
ncbi:MAG TPA: YceD family protein [Acidimicrobiales bacterium]